MFCTVTVLRWTTFAAPTSTTPKVTDTKLASSLANARTGLLTASRASTRPEPTRPGPYTAPVWCAPVKTSCVAVFITAALTSAAFQPGCAPRTSATMPATCGVAIDVPDRPWAPVPVPDAAE